MLSNPFTAQKPFFERCPAVVATERAVGVNHAMARDVFIVPVFVQDAARRPVCSRTARPARHLGVRERAAGRDAADDDEHSCCEGSCTLVGGPA